MIFEELTDKVMDINNDIEELKSIVQSLYDESNMSMEMDLDITKRKAIIETSISELSILFLRLPNIQTRFEFLRDFYKNNILINLEQVYKNSEMTFGVESNE